MQEATIKPGSIHRFGQEVPMNSRKTFQRFFTVWVFGLWLIVLFGCERADTALEFPLDHGPHVNVLAEWWYFTGRVQTAENKTLGYEFTIFKSPKGVTGEAVYVGHAAVSDPEKSRHVFAEVTTPDPGPDAGAEGRAEISVNSFYYHFSETEGFRITADTDQIDISLTLVPTMGVLPHGEDGIISMGDGIDSYYYSYTNLVTQGTISVNGTDHIVSSGRTWMDHQWGNYSMFGLLWDWFSLRLDDGASLMLFRFRDVLDNQVRSNWTYRSANGSIIYGSALSVNAERVYTDQNDTCSYPVDWTLEVPELNASFRVVPLFDAQCIYDVVTPEYWEGLCWVQGTLAGSAVSGSAYVELTGY